MLKRLLPPLIAAAAMLFSAPTLACHLYAGAHAGIAIADTRADLSGLKDGGASTGGLAGVTLGFDCKVDKVIAGLWADADLYRAEGGSPVVLGTGGAKIDHSFAAGAKLGFAVSDSAVAYGIAGWSWVWADDITAAGLSYKVPAMQGPLAGVGLETKISERVALDLQYRAVFLRDEPFTAAAVPVTFDGVDHSVRIGVNFQLGAQPAKAAR
jgi:opacity protein-like surface antigen